MERVSSSEAQAREKELQAKADSDAFLLQAQRKAEAIEREGTAEAATTEAVGLAKAKAIEAEGLAQARVIREKAFAEAEAKEKLAEAYQKYGQAAMTEMVVNALPEITKSMSEAVASSLYNIGKVTIVDTGGGSGGSSGVSKLTGYAVDALTQIPEVVKATTGIDMVSLLQGIASNTVLSDNSGKRIEDSEEVKTEDS